MKVFKNELQRRREERRQKRSSTWGGLLIKLAILVLLVLLIRFILSSQGSRFGEYWRETIQTSSRKGIAE
jgi:type VI protein secretion system component VasF